MPLVLTSTKKDEITMTIKKAFSDFRFYDEFITPYVQKLIERSTKYDFDSHFMNTMMEYCFGKQYDFTVFTTSKEKKEIYQTIRIILHATVIYLFSLHPMIQDRLYQTTEELLTAYPTFVHQLTPLEYHQEELNYLLLFRNYMTIALMLLPAKENKIFLLRILERLEGSNEQYITGTGQKLSTTRRCDIFHQESGTEMIKKRPRKPKTVLDAFGNSIPVNKTKAVKSSKKMDVVAPVEENSPSSYSAVCVSRAGRVSKKRSFDETETETISSETVITTASSKKSNKARKTTAHSSPRSISALASISPRPTITLPVATNQEAKSPNFPLSINDPHRFKQDKLPDLTLATTVLTPNKFTDGTADFIPNDISHFNNNSYEELFSSALLPLEDYLLFKFHPSPLLNNPHDPPLNMTTNITVSKKADPHHHESTFTNQEHQQEQQKQLIMINNEEEFNMLLNEPYQGSFTEDIEDVVFF